jgi:hypothetical protein
MSMAPFFGVPGKLKTLIDRLTATRAANLDEVTAARMARLDATISSRADGSVFTSTVAARIDANISTAGRQLKKQVWTSGSGNWTVPTGVHVVYVSGCGGGGGGGSGNASSSVDAGGGGGGGAAAGHRVPLHVVPAASVAYAVGAAGTGGAAGANDGVAGGASTFGPVNFAGGAGGQRGNIAQQTPGGAGGTVFASLPLPIAVPGGAGGDGAAASPSWHSATASRTPKSSRSTLPPSPLYNYVYIWTIWRRRNSWISTTPRPWQGSRR